MPKYYLEFEISIFKVIYSQAETHKILVKRLENVRTQQVAHN